MGFGLLDGENNEYNDIGLVEISTADVTLLTFFFVMILFDWLYAKYHDELRFLSVLAYQLPAEISSARCACLKRSNDDRIMLQL